MGGWEGLNARARRYKGCSIIEKILITIILDNFEITSIKTIFFEFEHMKHLFSISLPKNTL